MGWLWINCVVHAACCSGQKALKLQFQLNSWNLNQKTVYCPTRLFLWPRKKNLQNQNFVSLKSFFAKLDMKWAESTYWDCSSIFWRSNYILPQWVETFSEVKLFSGPVKPGLLRRHNPLTQLFVVCTLQKQNFFWEAIYFIVFSELLLVLHYF